MLFGFLNSVIIQLKIIYYEWVNFIWLGLTSVPITCGNKIIVYKYWNFVKW